MNSGFIVNTSPPSATSVNYFYDNIGRLTRAVTDTAGSEYQYDDLGNLVSVSDYTTTNGSPVITSINPVALFMGAPIQVTITGQNLLATDSLTSENGYVQISNVTISDTQITAQMTPLSIGVDTIRVTSRNGTPNTAGIAFPVSTLVLSPGQVVLLPGGSQNVTANIVPPITIPLTINLTNDAPSIASVPPSITIPAGGSTNYTVQALQFGVATIGAMNQQDVVFVSQPFTGNVNGLSSRPVSVYLIPPSQPAAQPVSVYLTPPSQAVAQPVSVIIQ